MKQKDIKRCIELLEEVKFNPERHLKSNLNFVIETLLIELEKNKRRGEKIKYTKHRD